MPAPQRRLGRGLNSLISIPQNQTSPESGQESESGPSTASSTVPVALLRPNPYQPRKEFDDEQLRALADSIGRTGLIQPIAVRQVGPETYEIIAGERRWRAAQLAGLTEIPAVVREASDDQVLEVALVENIFREDLNPIERAMAYRRYCDEFNLSAEDVAQRLGEDRSTVANYIRLLDLPDEVRNAVACGTLAMGHARCLLGLKSASQIASTARKVIQEGLSVRAVEKLVRDLVSARDSVSQSSSAGKPEKRPLIRELEQAFRGALGTKVEIVESRRKGRGKIVINYGDLDDFDRICERLGIQPDIG